MNIASLLAKSAITWAVRPALALGSDIVQSYSEHAEEAARLAGGLRHSLGLSPGERIGIAMKNSPAYSTTLFAAWHAGLAAVPMNAKLHAREFEFILKNAGITVCFVDDDLVTTLKDASQDIPDVTLINISSKTYTDLIAHDEIDMAETDPNDLAWLFYTSGTTGRPKGAMLSHRNLLMMTISYFGDVDPVSECDSLLHAAPMSHGSGLYILPYVAKGALQIIPRSGGFDPAEIAGLLSKYQNVNAFFAPTMVTRLINAPEITPGSTENLKTIVYGGGPMYVEDCLKALALIGPKLVQIYGQGEAPMTITALSRAQHTNSEDPRYLEKLASVGTARSDLEICIQGGDEQPLPAGEIGEVCVRGDVAIGTILKQRKKACVVAGFIPAISENSIRKASSHLRTAPRMSLSRAARTSTPAKLRRYCYNIAAFSKRQSLADLTSNGAKKLSPLSSVRRMRKSPRQN